MNYILIAVLLLIIYFLLRPIVRGAVYFPTQKKNMEILTRLAGVEEGGRIADLGSGDGRILMAFARHGIESYGWEINPLLVWWSRWKIKKAGLENKAFVYRKSFWREDLSSFDAVIVYGIPYIMEGLGKKLKRELQPGARVLSNIYAFPEWQAEQKEGGIYLYKISKEQ